MSYERTWYEFFNPKYNELFFIQKLFLTLDLIVFMQFIEEMYNSNNVT